jgi:preprotein translocase subunit SecA
MFVDLMSDLRKSVASTVFRAQLQVPERPRALMPKGLVLTGPSDTPETSPLAQQPAEQRIEQPTDVIGAALRGGRRLPATPGGNGPGPVPGGLAGLAQRGPDPSQLQTNRDGDGVRTAKPVVAADKVGRNDPCPCGSGKKFKKCHGVGAV